MAARVSTALVAVALLLTTAAAPPAAVASEPVSTTPVNPFFMEDLDGWLYFQGHTPETGRELFRTDGVTFELVADIRPGPANGASQYMEAMNGWVYFSALTTSGLELWRSNGDVTEMVADIVGGSASSSPTWLEAMDGWLYFQAYTPDTGEELWRSNGTDVTERVADIYPGPDASRPSYLEATNGWVYFQAYTEADDYSLWRSNGTTTELVSDMGSSQLEGLGGWLYFAGHTEEHGSELWRTNGTTTELVRDINPGPFGSGPFDLEALDGWVYFRASDAITSYELWRTNGTVTELVADINPGSARSLPYDLAAMDGWVYFAAETPEYGYELWRSDGATTELVADVNPGTGPSDPEDMTAAGGWMYFRASLPGMDDRLWRTDGTVTHVVGGELIAERFVDASRELGPKWTKTIYTPAIGGAHTFMLGWEGDANLRMSVKERTTGQWIGDNVSRERPKTVTVDLEAGTAYKVAVWAKSGAADYRLSVGAPIPPAGEEIFSETVDADRVVAKKWRKTIYTPVFAGEHTFVLDWPGDANLRISVKEYATGRWIGDNTSADHPKTVTVDLDAGVEYRVAVWAKHGSATFTVTAFGPAG